MTYILNTIFDILGGLLATTPPVQRVGLALSHVSQFTECICCGFFGELWCSGSFCWLRSANTLAFSQTSVIHVLVLQTGMVVLQSLGCSKQSHWRMAVCCCDLGSRKKTRLSQLFGKLFM